MIYSDMQMCFWILLHHIYYGFDSALCSIVPVYIRTAPTQRVLTQISIVTPVNILFNESCDPAVLNSPHLSKCSVIQLFIVFILLYSFCSYWMAFYFYLSFELIMFLMNIASLGRKNAERIVLNLSYLSTVSILPLLSNKTITIQIKQNKPK